MSKAGIFVIVMVLFTARWGFAQSQLGLIALQTQGCPGSIAHPVAGQTWCFDPTSGCYQWFNLSSIWQLFCGVAPLNFDFIGTPASNQKEAINCTISALKFPANFVSPTSLVSCGSNPSETDTYTVKDITANVTLGTIALSTSCVGTFATTGGLAQSCPVGDRLEVDAPGTVSGADIAITVNYTR